MATPLQYYSSASLPLLINSLSLAAATSPILEELNTICRIIEQNPEEYLLALDKQNLVWKQKPKKSEVQDALFFSSINCKRLENMEFSF